MRGFERKAEKPAKPVKVRATRPGKAKSKVKRAKPRRAEPVAQRRSPRDVLAAPFTAAIVSDLLAAEKAAGRSKFRVEFVRAPDDSWCLLLCHHRWAKAGWALATDVDLFDGAVGSGLKAWDIVRPAKVPWSIRAAYAKSIRNWKALAVSGKILDRKWFDSCSARSQKLQQRLAQMVDHAALGDGDDER